MFESFVLPAITFGLTALSIPGALQTYLMTTTIRHGWRKGIFVAMSPLFTDTPILILMVFVLGQLPANILRIIEVGGGLLLWFMAWGAFQQVLNPQAFTQSESETGRISARRVLLTAMSINFLSPGPYLFWGTVNGPLLVKALQDSPLSALAMLLGFYGSFVGGLFLLVALFHRLGKVSPTLNRAILAVAVVLLAYFGARFIVGMV